jgi:hypothetical protein
MEGEMKYKYLAILVICYLVFFCAHTFAQSDIQKPKFSKEHGFYEDTFSVTISNDSSNSYIRYTLDGSDPVKSNTSITSLQPVTITIDPQSTTGGRAKTPGVVLRACTVIGTNASESVTRTYLFINKIGELSPENVRPNSLWPAVNTNEIYQYINYGMDQSVLNDPRYKDRINDALLAIPSVSVVTDLKNLFSTSTGIYMNAIKEGDDWERPASLELINPDGSEGFQINAGIRIRGGASRQNENPKHAFRFFFRKKYGKGKLEYPMFGDEGVKEFDKIDFRTSQNYSWSFPGHMGEYNTMNRDVFSRDLQREMGQPYTRSRYYHLYINGVYWGIYQSQERSEANYAASYFGGVPEDYDVIKNEDGKITATDGNDDAWEKIYRFCLAGFKSNALYYGIEGKNTDGTRNTSYPVLVDIDNLIDYMMVIFFTGNFDSPTSIWQTNKGANNFYCIYNRNGTEGFKFFAHDAEHTLRTTSGEHWNAVGLKEDRVNIGTLRNEYKMEVDRFEIFHPQWLHFKLSDNPEYRLRFADHVYKQFFNNGVMTPSNATALFQKRAKEIELAIIGESARWGNTYSYPAKTKDDWQWAVDDIVNNYFPYRTNIVIDQLEKAGLYPDINPPIFGGGSKLITSESLEIKPGFTLSLANPNTQGTIYYTIDGSDPRKIGGAVNDSSSQQAANNSNLVINSTTVIKARIKNGDTWSAIHKITLFVNSDFTSLKITEINYHPLDGDTLSDDEYEFLELKNTGSTKLVLTGTYFENGITYVFPEGSSLDAGKYLVLASNSKEFKNRYGFSPFGTYSGKLDNGGERLTLCAATGDTVFSMVYDDKSPWPEKADGGGYSLVVINPDGDLDDPGNWRVSYRINGSPGEDDVQSTLVQDEILPPSAFKLEQNYPNPFNPVTNFRFSIKEYSSVSLKIYDMLGREVAVILNQKMNPGTHTVKFNASDLASGVYIARLQSGTSMAAVKISLLK